MTVEGSHKPNSFGGSATYPSPLPLVGWEVVLYFMILTIEDHGCGTVMLI